MKNKTNKQKSKFKSFSQWFWQEREYVDFWNIPHLLFGAMFFCICFLFNLRFVFSLILLIILKMAWEIYEQKNFIRETPANSVLDVITGIIGFLLSYFIINNMNFKIYFICIVLSYIILVTWGLLNLDKDKRIN